MKSSKKQVPKVLRLNLNRPDKKKIAIEWRKIREKFDSEKFQEEETKRVLRNKKIKNENPL